MVDINRLESELVYYEQKLASISSSQTSENEKVKILAEVERLQSEIIKLGGHTGTTGTTGTTGIQNVIYHCHDEHCHHHHECFDIHCKHHHCHDEHCHHHHCHNEHCHHRCPAEHCHHHHHN